MITLKSLTFWNGRFTRSVSQIKKNNKQVICNSIVEYDNFYDLK